MVLASRLALVAACIWAGACAVQRQAFDFDNNIGSVVTGEDGRGCLSLSKPMKAGSPVLIILPEPETKTYTAHVNDGSCKAEESMTGHLLNWTSEHPVAAIGVVLNGRAPSRDLDDDGQFERFRSCASREGLHLTVWSGEVRRWHAYHYLGYDTEADCTEAETKQ